MDERTSCEALELMSLWGPPICSGGIGGDWTTEGIGITVALAASTWELVVGGVGGPTVSQDASKVIGVALVWRGGELCRENSALWERGKHVAGSGGASC